MPSARSGEGVEALSEAGERDRHTNPFLRRLKDDEHGLLAGSRSCRISVSSISTSGDAAVGQAADEAGRAHVGIVDARPSPRGRSTPSGASTRRMRACLSAVFITDHREPDILAVLRRHELHDDALLILRAGRRIAPEIPIPVFRLHLALRESLSRNEKKQGEEQWQGDAR